MAIKGIDISSENGEVDWDAIKNDGINFAIIRIGIGSDQEDQDDKYAVKNMDECERIDMAYGVYIYSYALCMDQIHSEARHMLRMIQGRNPSMGIWYDMEDADHYKSNHGIAFNSSNSELLTDFCVTFCEDIKNAGYSNVGIYASRSPFESILNADRISQYPKWMAVYYYYDTRDNDVDATDYENSPYLMWQYSSFGIVNGSNDRTDMNYLYGDLNNGAPSSAPPVDTSLFDEIIINAYQDILRRPVDDDGLNAYRDKMSNGMSEDELRSELRNSDEAKAKFTEIVTTAYNDILHREPDQEGLDVYVNSMINGSTEDDIRNTMSNSDEAIFNKRNFIEGLYSSELGRSAEDGEVDYWVAFSEEDITNGIHNSDEANAYRSAQTQAEANRIAEEQRLAEEQKLAEEQRIALEEEQKRLAEEQAQAQKKIDEENAKLAERNKTISDAQTELDNTLSNNWNGYYTPTFDDTTKLYTLTENAGIDESRMDSQEETQRIIQKNAYDKYNSVILGLNG